MTKLTNKIKHRSADGSAEEDKQWTKQSLQTLKQKMDSMKGLDNQIIELIGSLEGENVEVRIEKEIEDRWKQKMETKVCLQLTNSLTSKVCCTNQHDRR